MHLAKKVLIGAAVAGLGASTLGVLPASASTPFTPNNATDWIRIGGSDTTHWMMDDLATLYNEAPGCLTSKPSGGTQDLSGGCTDQVQATPVLDVIYEPDGAGNVTSDGNPDHDVMFGYYPVGSSSGITQLTNRGAPGYQVLDVARSSRARSGSDSVNLRFFAFARDAIPWVKFGTTAGDPSLAVTNLTTAQLTSIFSDCNIDGPDVNTIADWGDVGGVAGAPLLTWAAQTGSGTRATFDGFLGSGKNSQNCIPGVYKDGTAANGERVIFENDATPIIAAGNTDCALELPAATRCDLNSISYYSLGRHSTSGGQGSILGAINGVTANETTVVAGTYPYSRFVYNVIRNSFGTDDIANGGRNFVAPLGFLCKPSSQHAVNRETGNNYRVDVENTIRDNGFFPLPLGVTGLGASDSHCRAS